MRIQHLYISEYKNLKNFTLDFDGTSFIDVFVGKNGTGKSNLFEALIEIFRHLYEKDHPVTFDYTIEYSIEQTPVFIDYEWEKNIFKDEKGIPVGKILRKFLPDNILIYYSGHNPKVNQLIEEYENQFKKALKVANIGDTREFIGIGKDYKSLLLSILLIQPDGNKAKKFITDKLAIVTGSELKIVLKRPDYSLEKPDYNVDRFVDETRFWRAQGITIDFLDKLLKVKPGEFSGKKPREENYQIDTDKYIFYFDITDFQKVFSDETMQSIFRSFDNLKTIGMLEDISLELTLKDVKKTKIEIKHFSDGQFQSIYIYAIIELFKDRNCITLLDEPDSFLHPEWQYDFLKQIFEITDVAAVNNHVLMTSHSATTLAPYDNTPLINLFTIEKNAVVLERITKSRAIDILSGGKINISENEARLNIIHFLNYTSGAVLFTEGISDEIILGKAWEKLYQDRPRPFEIQNAFDCAFLRNLIKRGNIFESYPARIFFALFDFDEAYVDWNQLGTTIETDFRKCLTKKYSNYNSYNMLLPVPNIDAISRQVLNPHTGGSYENNSLLTIESLFSQVPGLAQYFAVDHKRTDGFIKFTGEKVEFAKNVVPNIDSPHFEVFRPVFDFILSVINAPAN